MEANDQGSVGKRHEALGIRSRSSVLRSTSLQQGSEDRSKTVGKKTMFFLEKRTWIKNQAVSRCMIHHGSCTPSMGILWTKSWLSSTQHMPAADFQQLPWGPIGVQIVASLWRRSMYKVLAPFRNCNLHPFVYSIQFMAIPLYKQCLMFSQIVVQRTSGMMHVVNVLPPADSPKVDCEFVGSSKEHKRPQKTFVFWITFWDISFWGAWQCFAKTHKKQPR